MFYSCSYPYITRIYQQSGQTALIAASSGGNAEVVELLLSAGADVKTKDEVCFFPSFCLAVFGISICLFLFCS